MAKNYDITTLKKAILNSGGFYSIIAKRLKCEWHTAKKYVEKYPELKIMIDNENESLLDLAESKLISNIKDRDNTAIIFYLKTRGRKRGYSEDNTSYESQTIDFNYKVVK
jgi:hypothetical protein